MRTGWYSQSPSILRLLLEREIPREIPLTFERVVSGWNLSFVYDAIRLNIEENHRNLHMLARNYAVDTTISLVSGDFGNKS
jgi:hypothetical protein